MSSNAKVVIAIFEDQSAADTAAESLKGWTNKSKVISLGAVGTLNKEEDEVIVHIPHQVGKGIMLGILVGLIAVFVIHIVFTSVSVSYLVGALVGAIIGGVLGIFFRKATNLSRDELNLIGMKLDDGKVAVIATVDNYELETTSEKLSSFGGKVFSVPVDGAN